MRWSIGNGSSVRIDADPWIPTVWNFKPRRLMEDSSFVLVSQLIDPDSHAWRADVINRLFEEDQAKRILGIPLSYTEAPDSRVWHFSNSGTNNVRSGYIVATDLLSQGLRHNWG